MTINPTEILNALEDMRLDPLHEDRTDLSSDELDYLTDLVEKDLLEIA